MTQPLWDDGLLHKAPAAHMTPQSRANNIYTTRRQQAAGSRQQGLPFTDNNVLC